MVELHPAPSGHPAHLPIRLNSAVDIFVFTTVMNCLGDGRGC